MGEKKIFSQIFCQQRTQRENTVEVTQLLYTGQLPTATIEGRGFTKLYFYSFLGVTENINRTQVETVLYLIFLTSLPKPAILQSIMTTTKLPCIPRRTGALQRHDANLS